MQMKEVTLETERLLLRWFRETDFPQYFAMSSDPEVMRFLGGKAQTEIEAWKSMAAFMGHWYFRGFGVWAVEEKSTGTLVGRIGFMHPAGWPGFELGWTLARESWGKGYATEGAGRAMEYAFNEMRRERLISLIAQDNINSIKVAERLGETVQGETEFLGRIVAIYGISHDEWLSRQSFEKVKR
ncbi:MAG: GNAT family N-acetyltransferase [Pyrinomonadaceae bacterium]